MSTPGPVPPPPKAVPSSQDFDVYNTYAVLIPILDVLHPSMLTIVYLSALVIHPPLSPLFTRPLLYPSSPDARIGLPRRLVGPVDSCGACCFFICLIYRCLCALNLLLHSP
jgi:hypothetical protein